MKNYHTVFPGVYLVQLEVNRPELQVRGDVPSSQFIEIACCREGCMELTSCGEQLSIIPGDVTVHCRAEAESSFRFPLNRYKAVSVLIDISRAPREVLGVLGEFELDLRKMAARYHLPDRNVYVLKKAPRIAALLEELDASCGTDDLSYRKIRVLEILLRIRDYHEEPAVLPRTVSAAQCATAREVYRYLAGQPQRCPTIPELAQQFSISPTQLKEGFRHVYGKPLHTAAQELRMRYAASLLLTTDRRVAEIAADAGYANAAKFSSAFRKFAGCTPLQYRSRFRQVISV